MLEQDEIQTVEAVLNNAEGQRGIVISVLQKVQDRIGYLPEDAMRMIANRLGMSLSTVYGVASFYKQFHFKPRGKNIVSVCVGTACHVRGASKVVQKLQESFGVKPGETTPDRSVTLETVGCVGCCGLAPVMVVNEEIKGELTPSMLDGIIEEIKSGVYEKSKAE